MQCNAHNHSISGHQSNLNNFHRQKNQIIISVISTRDHQCNLNQLLIKDGLILNMYSIVGIIKREGKLHQQTLSFDLIKL